MTPCSSSPILRDRRSFLRRSAVGLGAAWMSSLDELSARRGFGAIGTGSPYGPVTPKLDEATGLALLQLPDGFRYISYAWNGDRLSDGTICPGAHDGMGVISTRPGTSEIVLVRNQELETVTPFSTDSRMVYAPAAGGGTVNLSFDTDAGKWTRSWVSLAGTMKNCAGGVTPWGSWLTCEETAVIKKHGWCFEVGADQGDPTPLEAMGRFAHEAVMVDPATGIVYETEDAEDTSGFYKFVPNVNGDLKQGGDLFMLKAQQYPNIDLGVACAVGTTWDVEWVRIDDPRAAGRSTFQQGRFKGGARFQRLEGAWWGNDVGYFVATNGGQVQAGQVFEYDPRRETLRLIYDSPAADECDYPDNITVTPRGGLLLCEDSGNRTSPSERLIGLTLDGRTFTFASNNATLTSPYNSTVRAGDYRKSEFAGCCYSPDGKWLFVNVQTPGITFAITGPWGNGPL